MVGLIVGNQLQVDDGDFKEPDSDGDANILMLTRLIMTPVAARCRYLDCRQDFCLANLKPVAESVDTIEAIGRPFGR